MKYSDLIREYIKKSGLTLDEISEKILSFNQSASKQYLSKLQNGRTPPASEELNRVIAEITGGNADALLLAAFIEKAPPEVKQLLEEGTKQREAAQLLRKLNEFIEFYFETGRINEDILASLHLVSLSLKDFPIDFYMLREKPLTTYKSLIIKLTLYLLNQDTPTENENKKDFRTMADVAMDMMTKVEKQSRTYRNAHEGVLTQPETLKDFAFNELLSDEDISKKMEFFVSLEKDLGLDLSDLEVQKKLKKAAKIIFSDED